MKKSMFKKLSTFMLALCVLAFALPMLAISATQNYPTSATGVQVIPIHISGQYTASTTDVVELQMPFAAKVLGISATARASGGTAPGLDIDVLEGGTTILSAPISVTAGTVSEATISDTALADESTVTISLSIGGGSPTWDDITILTTIMRRN